MTIPINDNDNDRDDDYDDDDGRMTIWNKYYLLVSSGELAPPTVLRLTARGRNTKECA